MHWDGMGWDGVEVLPRWDGIGWNGIEVLSRQEIYKKNLYRALKDCGLSHLSEGEPPCDRVTRSLSTVTFSVGK